jgi:uncharacterized protein YjbI with pentapeptide repeats
MDYGWNGITYVRWLIIRLWYAYARYAYARYANARYANARYANARYANARYANARLWKYGRYVRGIYVLKRKIEISFINSNKFIKGI